MSETQAAGSNTSRLALAAAWVIALVTLGLWLTRTPQGLLREQLIRFQFWSLEACLFLALGLGFIVVRGLRQHLDRDDLVRMAALGAVALCLTLFVAPRTNRIYYDEQIYQSIGQNLSDLRRAQMCLEGNVEYGRLHCSIGEYNKQPYAYPHLLSLMYRVGGVDVRWAFAANAVAMVLTVWAVYLLSRLLFDDRTAALYGALVLALTPQQLLWSATAAAEPWASLACASALVAMAYFARSRTTLSLLAAGVAAVYAVQFRMESLLIVPVAAFLLWRLAGDELRAPRVWWVALLCLVLGAVHFGHLYSVRAEGWGTTGARLSLDYVVPNFRVNGGFYAGDERFPIIYSALALVGLFAAGQTMLRVAMFAYFLVFFGIGLLFYAGSYNYGADVRYSLMTYPPVAVLAGLGATQLARGLAGIGVAILPRWTMGAVLALQFLWYAPLVRATTEEAWAARADVRFAGSLAAGLPPNSYVLTHNPGMFHVWGVNAGQMSLIENQPGRLQFLSDRYAGGVYLHWNFWCNVADDLQRSFCRRALAMAPAELVQEDRVRDQRFALYRFASVKPPAAASERP